MKGSIPNKTSNLTNKQLYFIYRQISCQECKKNWYYGLKRS